MSAAIQSLSIVIPIFNEEGSLPTLMEELQATIRRVAPLNVEVLLIDDGSMDGSAAFLRTYAAQHPAFKVVRFHRNYGQTAAMSCGISLATGDVIIPMDADLQNDPADIPRLLEKMNEGYACVSGWRKDRKDTLLTRKLPSWIANSLISWMTNVQLHDYGCTLKAYRRDAIQDVSLYGEMHRFIPAYVVWSGAKVTELVVNHRERVHGVSKYGLSRIFKVVLDLIVVKFLTSYFNRPIHFFGLVGFGALVVGIMAEVTAVILRFFGLHLVQTPLPIVGTLFIIVGIQFILFGLLAEVLMRIYYESGSTKPYRIRETLNIPNV